jgi:hypothetical protein
MTVNSGRARVIEHTSAIIWDEMAMANVAVVEAVHNVCCLIQGSDRPFGGLPFIGVGDFRQVAPVTKGSGADAAFDACVKSSPIWQHFCAVSLHQPIRTAADPEYSNFIDDIGENTSSERVSLSLLCRTASELDAIEFLYPSSILGDPTACLRRAFLSPRNIYVDSFNQSILDRLPSEQSKSQKHFNINLILSFSRILFQCGYGKRSRYDGPI